MVQILVSCTSPMLAGVLSVVKKVIGIIQIAGPILLMISLALTFTKLLTNPEDKKLMKKIWNSILAAVLLFFIPLLINIVMSLMGEDFNVSACWNSADNVTPSTTYTNPNEGTRKKIYNKINDYENGMINNHEKK